MLFTHHIHLETLVTSRITAEPAHFLTDLFRRQLDTKFLDSDNGICRIHTIFRHVSIFTIFFYLYFRHLITFIDKTFLILQCM